ncbi:hypothetical protein K504DRAFT_503380 [Pleomassaria siparia CBS 279.74]|uniref:Uncharacterized protein n=1 Tax=Pleomassaria siparia CBS 279.74 TaxID=1314801 RepID=A0A6G1K6N7_9PLEO|nr:hypothetical protein K504DRAFT_503380 [Pleomassaria siparia CBS 279.74]
MCFHGNGESLIAIYDLEGLCHSEFGFIGFRQAMGLNRVAKPSMLLELGTTTTSHLTRGTTTNATPSSLSYLSAILATLHMDDKYDDYPEGHTILERVKSILLTPLRVALSPTLLRTYLRTILILLTSTTLFAIAVLAYTTFYYSYIPVRGITVPVYLQFDTPQNVDGTCLASLPFGVAEVKGLAARQKYDVVVVMDMPRSRGNLEARNWMVGVEMRGPGSDGAEELSSWVARGKKKEASARLEKPNVLARSRRPAILTYRSWTTEHAYRFLRLPLYMVGWGLESEKISVSVLESVEFDKGWRNVPSSLRLDLRSATPLEVYSVAVKIMARLEGLRWIMYTYRLSSFVVFTSTFWGVEMGVVLMTWGVFTLLFGGSGQGDDAEGEGRKRIKAEPGTGTTTPKTELDSTPSTPRSDTSRTFPTLSSQQRLHYSSGEGPRLRGERGDTPRLDDLPIKTEADADDEDEDADFVLEEPVPISASGVQTDSGIGTSMESNVEGRVAGIVRRKSGRKGSREG